MKLTIKGTFGDLFEAIIKLCYRYILFITSIWQFFIKEIVYISTRDKRDREQKPQTVKRQPHRDIRETQKQIKKIYSLLLT